MRLTELASRLNGAILSEAAESTYDLDDLKNFGPDLLKKEIAPFLRELDIEKISPRLFSFIKQMSEKTGKPYKAMMTPNFSIGPYSVVNWIDRKRMDDTKFILGVLKKGEWPMKFAFFDPLAVYRNDRAKGDFEYTQKDRDQIAKKVQSLVDKKFGRGRYSVRCESTLSDRHADISIGAGPKLLKSFQDSLERAINSEESKPKGAAKGASGGQKWSVAVVSLSDDEAIEVWDDFSSSQDALKYAREVGVEDGTAIYVVKGTQRYLKPLGSTEEGDDNALVKLIQSSE